MGVCDIKIFDKKCKYNKCKYIHYQKEEPDNSKNLEKIYHLFESTEIFNNKELPS